MTDTRDSTKAHVTDDHLEAARTRKAEESGRILNAPAKWWTADRLEAWKWRDTWLASNSAYSSAAWTQAQERSVEGAERADKEPTSKPHKRFDRLARDYVVTEDDLAAARIHATAVLECGGLPSTPRGLVAALSEVFLTPQPERYAAQVLESFDAFVHSGRWEDLFAAGESYGRMTFREPPDWKKIRDEVTRRRSQAATARQLANDQRAEAALARDKDWATWLKRHSYPPFGKEGSLADAEEMLANRFGLAPKQVREILKQRRKIPDSALWTQKKEERKKGKA